ncbi:type III secretion protein [Yersinia alsatica]|uniref:type III secretion protein n=1 Tax=Yersinia alsatica TaxID=2890317 RepID=UPI0032EF536B
MLPRLLILRQRKERRLRRQLMELRRIYQQQQQQVIDFRQQRQNLCLQLQQITDWRGKLLPDQANEQRALQHKIYQAERELKKSLCELAEQQLQQQVAIESQQTLLRINQREQEKIRMLIKNETNRY